MKICATLLLFFLSALVFGQKDLKGFLEDNYPETKNYVVHGSVLRSLFNSTENEASLDAIKYIDKIIYSTTPKTENPNKDFNAISTWLKEKGIEEYVRVSGGMGFQLPDQIQALTAGSNEVGLYIKDEEGEVQNCVLLAKFEDQVRIFNVLGTFYISKLSDIDGTRIKVLQDALDFGSAINFD